MFCRLLTATVLLLGLLCGRAHCQRLVDVDMQALTERLGQRFQNIRTHALGVEALEAEYNRVGYTYSTLEQSTIDDLLANPTAPRAINGVLTLFNDLNSNIPPSTDPITSTTECCGNLTGGSNPQACCHSCNTTSFDPDLLISVAEAFRDASISGVELELGLLNGSLLRFPASQPSTDCSQLDARLQPWFVEITHARPREIVLLVDLNDNFGAMTRLNFGTLRSAARAVLSSLTPIQDKVGVIAFGSRVVLSPVNSNTQVVPVCSQTQAELDSFIETISNLGTPGNITSAFHLAFSLFTNDASSDKLLFFFTDGVLQYRDSDQIVTNITGTNQQRGNNTIISVFRAREPAEEQLLQRLTEQPIPGTLITHSLGESVGSYYLQLLNDTLLPSVLLRRTTASNGAAALSISRPFFQDSTLVGVFHAALPWRVLFGHIDPVLSNRDSSYFFVATRSGQALYHPMFPGDSQSDVSLDAVETEMEIEAVFDTLRTFSAATGEVPKNLLVHTGGTDSSGFILRQVPSTFYCRNLEVTEQQLVACLVLAANEVNSTTLRTVDVDAIYGSSSSSRQPIYHDTSRSIPATADRCNYFCKISRTDRISYQLTAPNVPPGGTTLETLTSFVIEAGPTPSWADDGIPSDVAINSIVSSYWLNRSVDLDDYISRRHLATPLGTYLTYPPAHLNAGFLPRKTEWYQASAAHTSTLTITPPREDKLLEGGLVSSIGYALRAPESGSDQDRNQVLSVVAADITFATLRVIVEDALPLCTQSSFSCFIVDSVGNLVYHRSLFEDGFTGDPPTFFARDIEENRVILSDFLRDGVARKQQCGDYFDSATQQRLFYNLNLGSTQTYSSFDANGCIHYMFRQIPGTNVFFAVVERRSNCNIFCVCNEGFVRSQCFDCGTFQQNSCECPCVCDNDDCTLPMGLPCPRTSDGPNLAAVEITPSEVSTQGSNLPPYCFNQACGCRGNLDSCLGVRECHWCEQQQRCVHVTECCDSDQMCCVPGSMLGRFSMLPLCIEAACFFDSVTPPEFTCPDESDNTAVIAGVIGGLVGFLLLVLFIIFILWYQICRVPEDYEDNEGKENAFDFSKRRIETVNITSGNMSALEDDKQQEIDSKRDVSGSKKDGASSGATSKLPETIL